MQWVSGVLARIIMLFWKGEIDGFGQKPYLLVIIFFALSSIWFSECCRHCNSWWMCFWIDKYCVDWSLFLCRCFDFWYGGMGLCFVCLGVVVGCVGKVGVYSIVVWVGCLLGLTNGWQISLEWHLLSRPHFLLPVVYYHHYWCVVWGLYQFYLGE